METAPVVIFVGLLVFLAHFFVGLFERTRIPDVLYLIAIGLFLGPIFRIVSPDDFGKIGPIFTEVALVVILFEGGLEVNIGTIKSSFRGTVGLTILSLIVSWVLLTSIVYSVTGLALTQALFVGAVLAAPAPSVIIPLARQLPLQDRTRSILTLESSLGEALGIVIALAILESFKLTEIRVGRLMGNLLATFAFAFVIGGVGGYVWSVLLHRIRQLRHAILTTPAYVFILYGVTDFLGYSGPVAALTCGIVLGNARQFRIPWLVERMELTPLQHNQTEKAFIGEVVFLIKTFFFVYLGLSIPFTDLTSMGYALLLTVILLLSRLIATQYSFDRKKTRIQEAALSSAIVPKGTAAAVLAALPVQMGVIGGEMIRDVIYGVIVFSIVGSSILVFLIEKTPAYYLFRYFLSGYLEEEAEPEPQTKP